MKKILVPLLFLTSLAAGCSISEKSRESINAYATNSQAFVDLMRDGKTSREQEQKMLVQQADAFHALNYAENDVPLPAHLQQGE